MCIWSGSLRLFANGVSLHMAFNTHTCIQWASTYQSVPIGSALVPWAAVVVRCRVDQPRGGVNRESDPLPANGSIVP